jgi:hypothetical protein
MKTIQFVNDHTVNFSLGNFFEPGSFHNLFNEIKKSLQKDQKELILGRRNRRESESYFNFMKFLFSSPDKLTN